MSKTFDEIAAEQGWNADSREQILKDFINTGGQDLNDYAQKRAFEENDEADTPRLPNLTMDVTGEYQGNAYPEQAEYRITMRPMIGGERFLLAVENSSGFEVNSMPLSMEEVDGIQKVASTNHSLDVYDGDWKIPVNIERSIHWDLGDAENHVRLDEGHLGEITAWLEYATGQHEWTGGENWEY